MNKKYTPDDLKQAERFVLEVLGWTHEPALHNFTSGEDTIWASPDKSEIIRRTPKITRAMIKELVEKRAGAGLKARKHYALTLQKVVHDSLPSREFYNELDLIFSELPDLTIAFWLAYKEATNE